MLFDAATIGAGPYGLAAASHLRQIKGDFLPNSR
jgi:cation diffusion facilitator CzcD-associated flavoprotein CzcO